ncbi:MAG: DUF3387 domain-containing protein [Caldilineaceae bacterium SB0668_bin_21]|nr:DUF3387 domain-containing protein [Caldilineaceae bacterium SB0668_bin_21]MYC22896.1 DUF3387 domain-containing protein [Caldilineaceae bacterium SB0662_bin_25]
MPSRGPTRSANHGFSFFDALETSDKAAKFLWEIARELVDAVRRSVTIDWAHQESVRVFLRSGFVDDVDRTIGRENGMNSNEVRRLMWSNLRLLVTTTECSEVFPHAARVILAATS